MVRVKCCISQDLSCSYSCLFHFYNTLIKVTNNFHTRLVNPLQPITNTTCKLTFVTYSAQRQSWTKIMIYYLN